MELVFLVQSLFPLSNSKCTALEVCCDLQQAENCFMSH